MKNGNKKSYLGILQIPDERVKSKLPGISYLELKTLACKLTKNHFDQQDIIQEMYVCLLISPPAQTKSWYRQHCYYRGIDYLRRNNHRFISFEEHYPEQTIEKSSFEIHNRIKQRDKLNQIKEIACKILTFRELSIFEYYFIKGKTQKEIAQKLDLTRACVAKKIKKICHKIRRSYVVYIEGFKFKQCY